MRCKVIGRKLFSLGKQPQYRLEDRPMGITR